MADTAGREFLFKHALLKLMEEHGVTDLTYTINDDGLHAYT